MFARKLASIAAWTFTLMFSTLAVALSIQGRMQEVGLIALIALAATLGLAAFAVSARAGKSD